MKSVARFWRVFGEKNEELREEVLEGQLRTAFDEVERLLQVFGFGYCFDLTERDGLVWLIFSPEGDPHTAAAIDQLVAAAPSLRGWRVFGRRQKAGLNDALVFVRELYGKDVSAASVTVVPSEPGKVLVKFFSKALEDLTPEMSDGLVRTLLDHLIGEDAAMRHVSAIETETRGSGAIPISKVEYAILRAARTG